MTVSVRRDDKPSDPRVHRLIPARPPNEAILAFVVRPVGAEEAIWPGTDTEQADAAIPLAE
jgi:hypothetical protein